MRKWRGLCYNRVTMTPRLGSMIRVTLAACALSAVAAAQAPDTVRAAPVCEGRYVTQVQVQTLRPEFRGRLQQLWQRVARTLGMHHETTSPGLVRRFVTLDPGKRCTAFRVAESERILRAQPFLADAIVVSRTDTATDSVRVDVSTVDEIPVIIGARLHSTRLEALNLGTLNFGGAGMRVEGKWEHRDGFREGYGGSFAHRQVFGKPYTLQLDGFRHPLGENYAASLSHAFLTDLQKIAWDAGYESNRDFAHLRRPDRTELLQPVDGVRWNTGAAFRIGPPRRLALAGGMVLGTRLVPRDQWSAVDTITGLLSPATDTSGIRHYPTYDQTNVAGVLGLRALTYSEIAGLDAIEGTQDVATGTQVSAIVGAPLFTADVFSNAFVSVDEYIGRRWARSFLGMRGSVESRLDMNEGDWKHMVASGRAAWYYKPNDRLVTETSVEGAGVWRSLVPFQIELGDRQSGVPGYARSLEAGSQRLLVRVEERAAVARYKDTRAAFGAAAFVAAGRLWAGDVPFGVNTPVRTSVGVALLAAVPAQSRRTIRAELAVPLARGTGARPELRFSIREPTSGFWQEPWRVRWSRLAAVPEQIFTWP
jgi:hypothetical protein